MSSYIKLFPEYLIAVDTVDNARFKLQLDNN